MGATARCCLLIVLCGYAGGPTHDYYNPALVNGPKFKADYHPRVDNLQAEKERLLKEGCTLIRSTDYTGKYSEAVELTAQAKRVHANHVQSG